MSKGGKTNCQSWTEVKVTIQANNSKLWQPRRVSTLSFLSKDVSYWVTILFQALEMKINGTQFPALKVFSLIGGKDRFTNKWNALLGKGKVQWCLGGRGWFHLAGRRGREWLIRKSVRGGIVGWESKGEWMPFQSSQAMQVSFENSYPRHVGWCEQLREKGWALSSLIFLTRNRSTDEMWGEG